MKKILKMIRESRLFLFFIISFLVHLIIFAHITSLYKKKNLSYIEFDVKDFNKSSKRDIPRPRIIKKHKKIIKKNIKVIKATFPKFEEPKDINSAATEDIKDYQISASGAQHNMQGEISALKASISNVYESKKDYYDMVRLRIESNKIYPYEAKSNNIEGVVKISCLIKKNDGKILNIKIIKKSKHEILNNAAIEAVKNSSPLPRPPVYLFNKSFEIEFSIVFELN